MKTLSALAGVASLLCLSALSAKAATLTNWARGGIATQSTTYSDQGKASNAIDGNILGGWSDATTTHTADSENTADGNPWWQVDLREAKPISHLHLWFREDCCFLRNDNLRVVIYDSTNVTTRVVLWQTNNAAMNGAVPRDIGFEVAPAVNGRVVYVEHLPEQDTDNFICITELEAFNQPLTAVANYARAGTATSSSCYVGDCDLYGPRQAIDGNHHGWTSVTGWAYAYSAPNNTAGEADAQPWWKLELPTAKTIGSVVLWPRHDRTFARYEDIRLTVADANNATLYQQLFTIQPSGTKFVVNFVPALANAKTVKLETTTDTPDTFLNLPEVEVFAPLPSAPTLTFTTDLQPLALNENLTPTFGPVAVAVDGGIRPEDISYRWYRNGVEMPNLAGSWFPSYTTPSRVGPSSSGDKYKVQASVSGYGVFSSEVTLTVTADTIPPVLKYATGDTSFNKVRVWFSEPVDPTTAQAVSNYQLSGGLTITSATLSAPVGSPGDNIVDLVTSTQTPGQTYTLTVSAVKDQSEAKNVVAAGSTVQFTSWVVAGGFLRFEVWNGLSTTDNVLTNTLTVNPRFPNSPDYVAFTTAFSSRPVYPDDTHEGYGGKMSGFIVPTETADYRFFLYSDDSSQLYLSTNASAQAKVLIAEETDCCDVFQEPGTLNDDGITSPISEPLHLLSGKQYYVEVLWKEGTGGDYCQVAWRKETDTTAAASLPVIPSQYLATYIDPNTDMQFVKQPTDQPGVVPSSGTVIFAKDFNANDGGFTVVETEKAPPGPWVYDGANGAWTADGGDSGCTGPYNTQLNSPAYKLTQDGAVSLEFSHRYSFESGLYDCGLVRLSVNGGAFTLVPAENFSVNGYAPGAIVGNGIALGQRGFNADSTGYAAGQFITSKALLGTFSKDDTLVVQFVGAWDDCSTASVPGWVINDLKLELVPMIIQNFGQGDGGFTVENSATPPPGPWAYVATNGVWQADGGADGCTGPYNSKLTSPAYTVPQTEESHPYLHASLRVRERLLRRRPSPHQRQWGRLHDCSRRELFRQRLPERRHGRGRCPEGRTGLQRHFHGVTRAARSSPVPPCWGNSTRTTRSSCSSWAHGITVPSRPARVG